MKSKILIVEDDETICSLLASSLSDDRTQVIAVRDGAAALEAVAKDLPDLIVMDICMPKMNGYDACKALRNDPRTRQVPVIMVSSLVEIADQLHGLKCGADDYVTKPFDLPWIGTKIQKLLLRRRAMLEPPPASV